MALSKVQLEQENQSNFPDNNQQLITPQLLREFNTDMIDSLVDENTYNADSASWNAQIAYLDPSGSIIALNALEAFTASAEIRLDALEQTSQSLNQFTASQAVSNSYFATTGSNTFTGNQTIAKEYHINTNGIYWNDNTVGYNNLEIINSSYGNVDIAAINGRVRIINSPLTLTGSALTSSNDISTSANIYAANLTGSTINTASFATTGSNTFRGTQTISGSVLVSSSIVANIGISLPNSTFGQTIIDQRTRGIKIYNTDTYSETYLQLGQNSPAGGVVLSQQSGKLLVNVSASFTGDVSASGGISSSTINGLGNATLFSASVNSRLLAITGSTIDTGSLVTTASFNAYTASQDFKNTTFATTSSLSDLSASIYSTDATQSSLINGKLDTSSFTTFSTSVDSRLDLLELSGSGFATTASVNALSASIYQTDATQSNDITNNSSSFATSISASNFNITNNSASVATTINNLSSSIFQTDATQSNDINSLTSKTGSYATTGSNTFVGNQTINGDISASGNISASSLYATNATIVNLTTIYETSSVIYSSGSNQLGDSLSDVQILSGSVQVVGGLTVNGVSVSTQSVDISSLNAFTASQIVSNSYFATTSSVNDLSASIYQTDSTQSNNISNNSSSIGVLQTEVNSLSSQTASYAISSSVKSVTDGLQNEINTLSTTASVNALSESIYQTDTTQSNNIASNSSSIGLLQTFSGSQYKNDSSSFDSRIDSLEIASGGFVTTASFNSYTSSQDFKNTTFATTGSNTFVGNQNITGSLTISSSAANDLVVIGRQIVTGSTGSPTSKTTLIGNAVEVNTTQDTNSGAFLTAIASTGSQGAALTLGVYDTPNFNTDIELNINVDTGSGIVFKDFDNVTAFDYVPFMSVAPNLGTNPSPVFTRGLIVTGSASFTELTGSLGAFSSSVNSRINSITVDTSSLVTKTSFNAYTQSTNTFTASISTSVGLLQTFSGSQYKGDSSSFDSRINGLAVSGNILVVQEEGTILGPATSMNFIGSGVTATISAGTASVTITGGGNIDTGSFITTGSYTQTQKISGSVLFSLDTDNGDTLTVLGKSPGFSLQQFANGTGSQYPNININTDSSLFGTDVYGGLNINDTGGKDGAKFVMTTYTGVYPGANTPIIGGGGTYEGDDTAIGFASGNIDIWKPTLFKRGGISVTGSTYFSELTGSLASYSASVNSRLNSGGGTAFPYTGSALITGSLGVTGSISSTLNSTFNGVTIGIGSGSAISNLAIGSASLQSNTGTSNIGIGLATLQNNRAASNVAIGNGNLGFQTFTGNGYNIAIGAGTLGLLGSGSAALAAQLNQNTIIGANTGTSMIVGARNTIVGSSAFLQNNIERNTGMGRGVFSALGLSGSIINGSGSLYNTAIGHNALFSMQSGSNNTFIHGGSAAGEGFVTGSRNIVLGMDSGLPSSMEGNTIIGRGITGISSTALTSNVIIADGRGNIAFQKNGATASVLIPSSVSVTGDITASGDISVGNAITASTLQLKGNNKVYFQTLTFGTSSYTPQIAIDGFQLYQNQGQPYAFNINLQAGQYNGISGSQFLFGLQTNGSGQSTFGGSTYLGLISGSLSQSVNPGTEIKGGDILVNSAGGLELVYNYAYAGFAQKVYMDKGLYVSGSGGSTALTLNSNGNAMIATGSVKITGSLELNGSTITSLGAGAFNSTNTQTGTANVSQSMTFNNNDINNQGISVNSSTQLTVTKGGTYNIQFSAQLLADTGSDTVYIWLKKNGTNVSNTATKLVLANNEASVAAWNWVVTASANDYFEIVWQSANGDAVLLAENSTGNIPAIPSVIATVTQVN